MRPLFQEMSETYTREELDRRVAEVEAKVEAEADRRAAEVEAEADRRIAEVAIQIRYEVFCEQRVAMKRCIRSCRNTEYLFVPPSHGN